MYVTYALYLVDCYSQLCCFQVGKIRAACVISRMYEFNSNADLNITGPGFYQFFADVPYSLKKSWQKLEPRDMTPSGWLHTLMTYGSCTVSDVIAVALFATVWTHLRVAVSTYLFMVRTIIHYRLDNFAQFTHIIYDNSQPYMKTLG